MHWRQLLPTLNNIKLPTWSFVRLQIFGPVLPFFSVKDVDEVINIINDRYTVLTDLIAKNCLSGFKKFKSSCRVGCMQWAWLCIKSLLLPEFDIGPVQQCMNSTLVYISLVRISCVHTFSLVVPRLCTEAASAIAHASASDHIWKEQKQLLSLVL